MTVLTARIAGLDAATESLMAVSGIVRASGEDLADIMTELRGVAPDSALTELPGETVQQVPAVVAARCQVLAARVADAASAYRALEATLLGEMQRAGGVVPVPR